MADIAVLGAGTWGIALARMLSLSGHRVVVWSAIEREIDQLDKTRRHPNLDGMVIPEAIRFDKALESVLAGADIALFAVPSVYVRATARRAAPHIGSQIIVDVAKGIETGTLRSLSQVIREEIPHARAIVALSGPSHAEEVARDMPTTIVSACGDMQAAEYVQDVFSSRCMRVYTSDDIEGVELCGALKNIIALTAGVSTGLGYGDNTRAALITRGMVEIARLGMAMGCKTQTFYGLAGIGDLIVTATSQHSRNYRCGQLLAAGMSVEEATAQVGMVVEGLNALPAAIALSARYGVEMPIISSIHGIVSGALTPAAAVEALMNREKKSEHDLMVPAGKKREEE